MDEQRLNEAIERCGIAIQCFAEKLGEGLSQIVANIHVEIPDYMLFEATHPRKKPRGSIRRSRRQNER